MKLHLVAAGVMVFLAVGCADLSDAGPTTAASTSSTTIAASTTVPSSTTTMPATTTTTTKPPRPITLAFVGDVLIHGPLWRQAQRIAAAAGLDDTDGVASTPPVDFTPMFDDVEPLIAGVDLAVCHLESPVAPVGEEYSTHPRYGSPAEIVDGVASAGLDHCSTASNHTFDRGIPALEATANRFDTVGITQQGMARTPAEIEPTLIDIDGTVIAHLSYSYGWDVGQRPADEPWRALLIDPDRIIADAGLARHRGADFVIASLHWGNSGSPAVSTAQRELVDILAPTGLVDLIVGHHAHVVQPIEQVGDMWVAYGLGNVLSNLPTIDSIWGSATQDGVILTVELDRTGETPAVNDLTIIPTWVDKDAGWIIRDVQASLDDPDLARIHGSLQQSLNRTNRVLGDWIVTQP